MKNKRRAEKARFPNYEKVDLGEVITFGTSIFVRKDKRALIILFPCGSELHFEPENE